MPGAYHPGDSEVAQKRLKNKEQWEGQRTQAAYKAPSRRVVALQRTDTPSLRNIYEPEFIGIAVPRDALRKKIRARLLKRLKAGMLDEAKRLHKKGLSWKRMDDLGLEYRFMGRCLSGKVMTNDEMIEKLNMEIGKYAKRQR